MKTNGDCEGKKIIYQGRYYIFVSGKHPRKNGITIVVNFVGKIPIIPRHCTRGIRQRIIIIGYAQLVTTISKKCSNGKNVIPESK